MSVDEALREREADGRPIRVGMVGAGATGRAIALQLGTPVPGIRLVAIANRTASMANGHFGRLALPRGAVQALPAKRKLQSPAVALC